MVGPWLQKVSVCAPDETGCAPLTTLDAVDANGRPFQVRIALGLVRGGFDGRIQLRIVAIDPRGTPVQTIDVEGDPPGIPHAHSQIVVPIELAGAPGLWWFDIRIGGATITRVPLQVR
jgi:hypothetical protein